MTEPKLTIETITPERAKRYLEHNKTNRALRLGRVNQYAIFMRRDEWLMTGDPLVFDKDGNLIQGQHRLAACVQADTPFTTAILRGADTECYAVLDSGLGRTVGDALRHAGLSNQNQVAAVGRLVLQWRYGLLGDGRKFSESILRTEQIEFCLNNRDRLADAALHGRHARLAIRGCNPTAIGTFAFEALERDGDPERLTIFLEGFIGGAGLPSGDPRLALRNSIINYGHESPNSTVLLMNTVKAWNRWVRGEKLANLKTWRAGLPVIEML